MTTFSIDRNAALVHLKALGYQQGDRIYLRAILPGESKVAVNVQANFPDLPWTKLERYQQKGFGIYVVVNGGGHEDIRVKTGKAVFIEHDDLDKDTQQRLWQYLDLPAPTIQIDTGGKSIHSYWRLSPNISVEQWRELQTALLDFADADRILKNPSRVMRLAGSWHTVTHTQSQIVSNTGQSYEYQSLWQICQPETNTQVLDSVEINTRSNLDREHVSDAKCWSVAIPLENCLTLSDRSLIESGAAQGERNASGAKLARNLIGTANYLSAENIRYQGTPRLLFDYFCHHCNPPLDAKEAEQIWKSAEKDNPTPSLPPDYLRTCITAWERKQSNGNGHKINTQVLKGVETNTQQNPGNIKASSDKCWSVATQREVSQFQVTDQLDLQFNLNLLPRPLAEKIAGDAAKFNIDPVTVWQYLLPTVSSLMGGSTWLDMSGFRVPNIIWTMQVLVSGGGKSRAKNLTTATLDLWQQQESEEYGNQRQEYQEAKKRNKDEYGVDQKAPKLRKYIFNVATPQAVVRRLADLEDQGCIWVRDEVSGLFKSLDQFTGEGEGLEILLESWDGHGCAVDRVDVDNSYYIPSSRLNIAGGIQPSKVAEIFPDQDDSQGVLARFLVAMPKKLPVKRVKGFAELSDYLPHLYRWVLHQHWDVIRPTPEADDFFTQIVESFGNEPTPNAAIGAWMAKLAGQTARIALVLHAIECFHDRGRNTQILQLDILERAYQIALYYRSCTYAMHGQILGNTLSSLLSKIQRKAETEGRLAMADIYRNLNAIRRYAKEEGVQISEYTLSLCRQLEGLGKGNVIDEGGKFYYEVQVQHSNTPTLEPAPSLAAQPSVAPDSNQHSIQLLTPDDDSAPHRPDGERPRTIARHQPKQTRSNGNGNHPPPTTAELTDEADLEEIWNTRDMTGDIGDIYE
jgi:hypothetical protein